MIYPTFFDSKNSYNLFGHKENFDFLYSLYQNKNLPNILLLSGDKATGKATLINHFLFAIHDKENYDKKNNCINGKSNFYNQFKANIFQNIIYLKGSEFKSIKIDEIRELKKKIQQSPILNTDRFIILDDVELFNTNSLNALLKIIEEPGNNYFVLINNKSRKLLNTIQSRSIEIKVILKENDRLEIINKLIDQYNLNTVLDPVLSKLSPGNFIKFDYICNEYELNILDDFTKNLSILLGLYKKNKDILYVKIAFFIADYYLKNSNIKQRFNQEKIYEIKNLIFDNLNNFLIYNLNQNSIINAINEKLNYE
tara:strand:+ start:1037 stop:1969 length:933 start_codon:yes stop_codon:yes gene_type:complete